MNPPVQLPSVVRRWLAARVAQPAPRSRGARTRRACLYKVDRLGDFVLALGALRRLVAHYGEEECRLVVSTVAAPLAAAEFPRVARWEVPPEANGVWRDVRPLRALHAPRWAEETFADLVCLRHARNLYRDCTLGWLHAGEWRGLGPRPRDVLAANRPAFVTDYPIQADAPWCRELLAHSEVVARATGTTPDWSALRPRLESVTAAPGGTWLFCPYGGATIRDYPADHWIEAWRAAGLPAGPVEVMGPATRAEELGRLAARLRQEAGRTQTSVATDLPPLEFVARLARARGIVTVESAAAHLATALDRPATVVTGGGHFGCFAPWGEPGRQHWVFNALPCYGCDWACPFPTVRCLADLPADSVAAAMRRMAALT